MRQGWPAESVTLFDIYEETRCPRAFARLLALRLRAADHTLTAKESEAVRKGRSRRPPRSSEPAAR